MKFQQHILKYAFRLVFTALVATSGNGVFAQETPLSLGDVMTALQSTSSRLTISQKNTFIKQRVEQRGVTFTVSPVISDELKRAGASVSLIAAIRENGPQSNQTSTTNSTTTTPSIKFTRLWVEQNVVRDGRLGLMVHTNYTAYNLLDTPLQLTIRFQDSNKAMLKSSNESFANKSGELALFKNFKPGHLAAVYKDWAVFVPYEEMSLTPGRHTLKVDADIIHPEGKLQQHMTLQEITVDIPRPSLRAPKAEFEKMWVDYGVREAGLLGMRIHVKLKTYNLKDRNCYLKIMFEKDNGDRLTTSNTLFSDRSGRVTLYSALKPGHATAVYNDIAIFMPYKELNLPSGNYKLKMHGDLVYPDGGLIQHLNFYGFTYKK